MHAKRGLFCLCRGLVVFFPLLAAAGCDGNAPISLAGQWTWTLEDPDCAALAGLFSASDSLGNEVFAVSQNGFNLTANFTDLAGNAVTFDLTYRGGKITGTITVQQPSVGGAACIGRAYVVNNFDNNVSVIDLATNTVIGSTIPVGSNPRGLDISPDGSLVFVPNRSGNSVTVIRTSDNTVVTTIALTGFEPYNLVFAPNGATAYVVNKGDSSVSVINVATLTETTLIALAGSSPEGVAITPDGSKVYAVCRGSGTVDVINTAANTLGTTGIVVGSGARDAQVLPNGSKVYVATESSGTSVISTATDTTVATLAGSGRDIEVSPDSTRVYVAAGPFTGVLRVINATNDTLLPAIALGTGAAYGIDLCGNGTRAYVSDDSGLVAVVDLTVGAQTQTIAVGSTPKSLKILETGAVGTGRRLVGSVNAGGAFSGNSRTVDGKILILTDSGGNCRGMEFGFWAMMP